MYCKYFCIISHSEWRLTTKANSWVKKIIIITDYKTVNTKNRKAKGPNLLTSGIKFSQLKILYSVCWVTSEKIWRRDIVDFFKNSATDITTTWLAISIISWCIQLSVFWVFKWASFTLFLLELCLRMLISSFQICLAS